MSYLLIHRPTPSRRAKRARLANGWHDPRAFTLLETIVAVTLLAIVIVSTTSLILTLTRTNRLTIELLQAQLLAREGLEAVRNMRDSNWLLNQPFRQGGTRLWGVNVDQTDGYYIVETHLGQPNVAVRQSTWNIERISGMQDERNQLFTIVTPSGATYYTHAGGTVSPFRRVIRISDGQDASGNTNPGIARVESIVTYSLGGEERTVSLITDLTDWLP